MIEGRAHDADAGGAPLETALAGSPRGVITFFYYEDLAPGGGLLPRPDRLPSGADVRLVRGVRRGPPACAWASSIRSPAASALSPAATRGAILSLEVDDLDACLERLKRLGAAEASTRILHGCAGRTREFKVLGPGRLYGRVLLLDG